MSENSKIEWCDHTFNPWEGCQKVSPGCDHCYAESRNARFGGGVAINWGPSAPRRRTSPTNWRKPLQWNAAHDEFYSAHGRRQRVFCASLADVFDNAVDPQWRGDLFELIRTTPNLDWLLLTKRPQNIVRMVRGHGAIAGNGTRYLPDNVWLGTTVEDQTRADQNIPVLLRTIGELGARVTFLSVEPMLGPVEVFSEITGELLHTSGNEYEPGWISWVICGGESGRSARPMHPAWARSLRDQCAAAGVPFFYKQWGEWAPGSNWPDDVAIPSGELCNFGDTTLGDNGSVWHVGKKAAGRVLDGRTHDEFPA
jgi:protein gp37